MASVNLAERKNARVISHSEINTLDTCPKRHDLQYSGQLLGGETLRPKTDAPILRDGRAWGAMVAAWHQTGDVAVAELEMRKLLDEDADKMLAADVPMEVVADGVEETSTFLINLLADYCREHDAPTLDPATSGRIPGDRPEEQLLVPLLSRSGKSDSNRYVFDGRLDLVYTDERGLDWIIEFKLRKSLTSYAMIKRDPQFRRYAWAWKRATGREIAGVIIDERRKDVPLPPRMVKAKKMSDAQKAYRAECKKAGEEEDKEYFSSLADLVPSHAKDQLCTAEAYEANCKECGVDPDPETVEALTARQWQQRVPIFLSKKALEIVGLELTGAGQDIHNADTGMTYPRAKPSNMNCGGCPFNDICDDLDNTEYIDFLFNRKPPKAEAMKAAVAEAS